MGERTEEVQETGNRPKHFRSIRKGKSGEKGRKAEKTRKRETLKALGIYSILCECG
jgi:hypothetical protein